MIDILYPIGGGSHVDDLELRYSLRSIEKHFTNYRNVFIVGKLPEWIKDVIHIDVHDDHPCKETNIYKKILAACYSRELSDDFLFFNDDHFILQDFEADKFPFYYKGGLLDVLKKLPPYNKYSTCVHNTAQILRQRGHAIKNFDTHAPIIYNKHKFIEIMQSYDWSNRFSYVVKSLYSNSAKIEGIKEPDCKMNELPSIEEFYKRTQDRKVFSIGNGALVEPLYKVLEKLYPNKSRWES